MRHSGWGLKQEYRCCQCVGIRESQPQPIIFLHLTLPLIILCSHTSYLHVLFHCIHYISSLLFPLASCLPVPTPASSLLIYSLSLICTTSACLSLASLVLSLVFSFVSTLWQTSAASQIYFSFYPSTVNIVVLCSAFCLPFISFLLMQFASPSFCHARFPFIYLVICLLV